MLNSEIINKFMKVSKLTKFTLKSKIKYIFTRLDLNFFQLRRIERTKNKLNKEKLFGNSCFFSFLLEFLLLLISVFYSFHLVSSFKFLFSFWYLGLV
jgi:hypothetical protein